MRGVTVVIPTIVKRDHLLTRAIQSCHLQTMPPDDVIVQLDTEREGAWVTRNKGIMKVQTEWTAFLDDDDTLLLHHLEFLTDRAAEFDLDLCWGYYEVVNGGDPFPASFRGLQYNPEQAHVFPITVLVKTAYIQAAVEEMGGFQPDPDGTGNWGIQDQPVWDHIIVKLKAKHMAFPDITWRWHHHSGNTSGLPTR